jgi:hypothetical protein
MTKTGSNVYALYKLEGSTYKTTSETNYKSFGHDIKLTSFQINNNVKKHYGIGNYEALQQVGLAFEGSMGLDFVLGDPWWFSCLTGNIAATTGAGPYTHKFIDTGGSPSSLAAMKSMTIDMNYDFSTASHHTIKGAVINKLTMNLNVDEDVRCQMDLAFADSTWSESALTTKVNSTDAPYTFAYASVEFPTSTTITKVQSATLGLSRNPEIKRALGSRVGNFFITKKSDYDFTMKLPFDIATLLKYTYGSSSSVSPDAILTETANMKVLLNNGAATTANRQLEFNFVGQLINTLDTSASVEDLMTQDAVFSIRQVSKIQAINNTSTQPV